MEHSLKMRLRCSSFLGICYTDAEFYLFETGSSLNTVDYLQFIRISCFSLNDKQKF